MELLKKTKTGMHLSLPVKIKVVELRDLHSLRSDEDFIFKL